MNVCTQSGYNIIHLTSSEKIRHYLLEEIILEKYENSDIANKYGIITAAMSDPNFQNEHEKIKLKLNEILEIDLRIKIANCIVNRKKLCTIIE